MATEQQIQDAVRAALEADRAARVTAVSVKLPPFWPEKTRLWFAQAEAQFDVKGITVEKTKYSGTALIPVSMNFLHFQKSSRN